MQQHRATLGRGVSVRHGDHRLVPCARMRSGEGVGRPRLARILLGARRRASGLRLVRLRAGRFEIPALVGGPDRGVPLVMLHGFSDTKDSFVDVARSLTRTRRVILPDLPGFSEASQPIDHHYTVPSMGASLLEALRELAPCGAHLVGNSLGGAIAAWATLEHPEWVRSLTLIGAAGVPMPVPSAMQRHIEAGHNPFVVRGEEEFPAFLRFVLERMPLMPGPVMQAMARDFVVRRPMNEKILDELVADGLDLSERLSEIAVPTLLLWGDRDRLIDLSAGRVYHRLIPRARLVVMHGIGHCPQVEAPRATARRIVETMAAGEA
ncbi:alpha/beta fold hydrolase [Paraliomyxa miuraensis]|uniref:alpha/beta fold hydrolase n=1 Tax=Paraliomyxa miuraensis TaxID=376150 RepID=UPI0022507C1C|nr:alpha/beta hydrolase [Paraliomyxa miuraensis]MCX4247021.1 alpha/beta hydrolase [Paraliomyxa miuraensis]